MMLDKMEKSKLMAKSFKQLTDKSFHARRTQKENI